MFGDFPINGKIAVITGGGSGINLAFARTASSQGAKVIIADLRLTTEAEEFIKEAKDVISNRCDVTVWSDLHNLIAVSKNKFGDVPDIYIAGAGIFEPTWSNFYDDTETERYAEVDINVNHPIKLTRIAMRALLGKDKKGVVLIIASVCGLLGTYSAPLYTATKHAMVGFTKSMAAADRLEGVKIVAICPGVVRTPLWTEEKTSQFSVRDIPSNTTAEVADAMVDLIQDGKYAGGTVLEITVAGTRVIPLWNIDPPPDAAFGSGAASAPSEMIQKTVAPMIEKMKSERGVDL
ncbi:MAG: hypothetical protein M1835_007628 [Candelina submexicana]|nr:MAG: hypothetical protein M1835_007628 [Candelina submexicana]